MKKEGDLQALNGQLSTMRSDIDRMQLEFDQLQQLQARYEKLRQKGFFFNQGRRQAEKVLERIQREAGVISAVAEIESGTVEDNEEAQKAEHKILTSPVSIEVEATDPVDVFRYIYLLQNFFPGHVTFKNITLSRHSEVTNVVLRAIASGTNPVLVRADINLVWRTMIPTAEIIQAPSPNPGGGI
ncbi:MAG: hypothetical protein IT558_00915 [Alphaproteobacteria bacterium]|nr:hypothetical protein [Alphaproteobacteria bacterium]